MLFLTHQTRENVLRTQMPADHNALGLFASLTLYSRGRPPDDEGRICRYDGRAFVKVPDAIEEEDGTTLYPVEIGALSIERCYDGGPDSRRGIDSYQAASRGVRFMFDG